LLFVLFCVLFVCKCVLPPGDNPIAVNKYIIIIIILLYISYVTTCFGLLLWPSSGYNLVALRVYIICFKHALSLTPS
jgi:hypothetical protein